MSYNVQYRISYKRFSNSLTTIDILGNGWGGGITTLEGDATPLTITTSADVTNIYTPTVGSGAVINVLATPLSLIGLFTADPQAFVVKCYNGTSGTNLFWQGYINSAVYTEDYSANFPVPISINCNDGMAVLDSLYYSISGITSFYTGSTSIGNVINTILGKLSGVTYNNIYTSHSLTTDGSTTNLFLNLVVNNDNYVDESSIPMTCRDTLNSILGGLGLVWSFKGSDIYIINPIDFNLPANGLKYTLPAFSESTSAFGGYLDFSGGTISYYETGQSTDVIPQLNEVDIKYNPYTITDISYDFNDTNNWWSPGSWSYPTGYCLDNSVNYKNWNQSGTGHFIGVKDVQTSTPEFTLYLTNTNDTITYINSTSIYTDSTLQLKITFDSFFQTKVNSQNIYSNGTANPIYGYYVQYSIMIGNQYWKDDHWESGQTGNYKQLMAVRDWSISDSQYVANNSSSMVGDTWATAQDTILLTGLTGGQITLIVYDYYDGSQISRKNFSPVYGILLKNLKLEFLDAAGISISNTGILKKGNVSPGSMYKNSTTEIATTNGTGTYGISRGAFFYTTGTIISGLSRAASVKPTEDLLLQDILSEYELPRLKFLATINVKNYMLNLSKYIICDNKYLRGKGFYIVNSTYDDENESMQIESLELTNNRDTTV